MNTHERKYNNTKHKIERAFLELLENKDFDDISISEICTGANIHRSTFYSHYFNTVELLNDI